MAKCRKNEKKHVPLRRSTQTLSACSLRVLIDGLERCSDPRLSNEHNWSAIVNGLGGPGLLLRKVRVNTSRFKRH